MNGSLLGDAGKELAQRAIETLSGWGLALSPQNYELAVAYLSGERRDIVSAVDEAIEGGAPSQVALDAIANECLKNGKVSEAVEKTGGRLSEELAAVMTRLEVAGGCRDQRAEMQGSGRRGRETAGVRRAGLHGPVIRDRARVSGSGRRDPGTAARPARGGPARRGRAWQRVALGAA